MMDLDALRSAGQNIQMPGTMKARLTTKVSVPPRKKILRRALAAALAICLCLGVGTAAAAGTEPVYSGIIFPPPCSGTVTKCSSKLSLSMYEKFTS